jgi:hypothetical protein
MHGREYITGETALRLVDLCCSSSDASRFKGQISAILSKTSITFIPVVNKVGRKRVESGASCTDQRKNANGVDINRNFPDYWGEKSSKDEETYPGSSAMSEPETKMVRDIATDVKPHGYVDIHSGDLGMGWVYGYNPDHAPNGENRMEKITEKVNSDVFGGSMWTGRLAKMGGSSAYSSLGCSSDYMFQTHNAAYSGTWEIWRNGGSNAAASLSSSDSVAPEAHSMMPEPPSVGSGLKMDSSECFEYFCPMTSGQYDSTTKNWADAILSFAKHLPDHVGA